MKYLIVKGSVLFFSLEVKSNAYINSLKLFMNIKIAALDIAGLLRGSMTLLKILKKPAPSIRADSISSFGTDAKKFLIKNKLVAMPKPVYTMINAIFVSYSPNVFIIKKIGCIIAFDGISMDEINRAKITPFPLNSKHARTYPAME